MFYKQLNSGGQIVSVGTTLDNTVLPNDFTQISETEYNSFLKVFSVELTTPELTPLNDKHELILE